MTDIVPKITDINSLKGLSTILALPMLCVAYILQTSAQISLGDRVLLEIPIISPAPVQLAYLLAIFVLKSLWASIVGSFVYGIIFYIQVWFIRFPLIELISVMLLTIGLFGIFGFDQFLQLSLLSPFWFYAFLIWGLFFHSMKEQFEISLWR